MLELADLSRTIIGLGIVLLLLAVVFWLLRRFGPQGAVLRSGGERRLALIDSLALDPRTRLLLVRQDAVEHLLVVSSTGSTTLVGSGPVGTGAVGAGLAGTGPARTGSPPATGEQP